jgi:hypothetical protein
MSRFLEAGGQLRSSTGFLVREDVSLAREPSAPGRDGGITSDDAGEVLCMTLLLV